MSKLKKSISDSRKIKQIKNWNASDISKQSTNFRSKTIYFDTTTRFLDACINFYKDEINDLLKSGIDINCADKDNLTAIHQACINSRIDLVDFLLEKNANINVCDKEGWTPLHIAADIGSYELAKYLIEHGARLDVANHDGDLPAMLVDEKDYPDLKIYFQKEMDKRRINTNECSNYERDIMLEDIKKWNANGNYNPPIDRINKSTPVHVAASKNYVEILMKLLPLLRYEDINAQDIDGWTALHAAAHWGHKEACKLLIIHGADIDIRTRANESVLDTVDPDLKAELTAEIKKAQIEKEKLKTYGLKNEIFMRSDTANKRRSSIARQSVEWKKNAQMKDPVSERQTLIKAGLNSETTIAIEESDEKMVSFQDNQNKNNLEFTEFDEDKSSESPFTEQKEMEKLFSSEQHLGYINTGINHNKFLSFHENVLEPQYSQIIQFSNGDNSKNNASSIHITENVDSHNGSLINEFYSDTHVDSKEVINAVKMRPKSARDEIISHRNTATSRLSLVMAPAKSDEAEVSRREKARRVRSMRRSTQAIDLGGVREIDTKKMLETIKSDSMILENPLTNCSTESNNPKEIIPSHTQEHYFVINEKNYSDNQINLINESIDLEKKEITVSECQNSSDTKDVNESGSFCGKLNIDNIDSSSAKKASPLKHQISCPISHIVTTIPTIAVGIADKLRSRGINVNKYIESNAQIILNSEIFKEKNSGSFVANKIKKHEFEDNSKNKQLEISIDQENSCKMEIVYENADVCGSKEDNPISKTILTRMLHDQTTKLELTNENNFLKEEIKEINEKSTYVDSNLFGTGDRKVSNEDDEISKLEKEMSKLHEENQRLKLQNESLLRVISRIQQELETLR